MSCLTLFGCAAVDGDTDVDLDMSEFSIVSAEVRRSRSENVRDIAAEAGITNGALLAGIAQVETGFAHCWSEATWACQGPHSNSCGGPVIAGAADGPCGAEQGGLGMFQFDAGTYAQTLARDGQAILDEQGNIAHAIEFVVARVIEEIPQATDPQSAADWMNSIPIQNGHPLFEAWGELTSCRYNGCCAASCSTQRSKYKNAAIDLYNEFEPGFWDAEAASCGLIPAVGATIDDDDACAYAGGNPEFWRTVAEGHGGSMRWTHTTALGYPNNYALWKFDFEKAGRYRVEAYIEPGENAESQLATYQVTHAAGTTDVVIDQSSADGFEDLGEFEFAAGGGQQVRLDDNTGEPNEGMVRLAFDAIRVVPTDDSGEGPDIEGPGPDDSEPPEQVEIGGGCSLGPGGPSESTFVLLLLAMSVVLRRRRN